MADTLFVPTDDPFDRRSDAAGVVAARRGDPEQRVLSMGNHDEHSNSTRKQEPGPERANEEAHEECFVTACSVAGKAPRDDSKSLT